ncbi:DUF4147 domain-containing protein, partial [Candidatus Woesearchaeota archaeon]|nr:DUF4147 domain-containing protein [Candidatus Woesearchaeota archaeon]
MIKNHKILASTGAREKVLSILEKGVEAALPENVVKNSVKLKNGILTILDKEFKLKEYKNVFVIGGGKASYKMAEALNRIIGERISYGYVNSTANAKVGKITINKAGHPKPDDKGVLGVKKMLSINPSKDDMAICLISGGGSAMMPLPVKSISLEDLRKTNGLLLKAGATIFEVNTVRKHLSQISGGRLAAELYPATVISLIISDVMGDELSVIASGPTVADKTCFKDAMIIIEDYGMADKVPKSVTEHLLLGVDGKAEETVKEGDERIGRVYNFVIANNITALKAMEEEAQNQGLKPQIVNPAVNGEAREAGVVIAEEVLKAKSGAALIFG